MTVTMDSLSDSRHTLARLCLLAVKAADKTWKGVDPRRVRDSWGKGPESRVRRPPAAPRRAGGGGRAPACCAVGPGGAE